MNSWILIARGVRTASIPRDVLPEPRPGEARAV